MRRALTTFAALSFGIAMIGCTNKPGKDDQSQRGPEWTLKYVAGCGDEAKETCLAAYGFSIDATGKFTAGPTPSGALDQGMLSQEELTDLKTLLGDSLGSNHVRAEETVNYRSDADDVLSLSERGKESLVVRLQLGSMTHRAVSADKAQELRLAIRDLANKYYPTPFDGCTAAGLHVESLYSSFQGCQTDADCAYVNANFEATVNTSGQTIYAETCTVVRPIAVGNRAEIVGRGMELKQAYAQAAATCKESGRSIDEYKTRGACTTKWFPVSADAPICQQGACKINPSIFQ